MNSFASKSRLKQDLDATEINSHDNVVVQEHPLETFTVNSMSRNSNKNPVRFATHVIAGGIAGACEAVSLLFYLVSVSNRGLAAGMSAPRYHKGPDAALEVRKNTRSM